MTDSSTVLQINSKKQPKWIKYLILALPVIISCFQTRSLDNDFYFLYSTGEYIVKNGFPFNDILSMHSSMKLVVQQWLSSVIFYYVYGFLGEFGIIALLYLCNIGVCLLTYRFVSLITGNGLLAASVSALANILIFDPFMVTRPQMFTYVILLSEVCLLERHAQTKKVKYLIGIPVLSILLVNLHAAMWLMLLVFMLPYLAASLPVQYEPMKISPAGNPLFLFAAFAVSIIAGILNPYGTDSMLYLFSSYGQSDFSLIMEMAPSSLSAGEGRIFFILFGAACLVVFFIKQRLYSVRFFLLFAGTFLLGLMQIKGIPYFLLFGIPAFTYMLKDTDFKVLLKPFKNLVTKRVKALSIIFLICALGFICEGRFITTRNIKHDKLEHYSHLNDVVDILDKSNEPVVLYTNFNDGQYLEFNGYHPYIDGRAEIFLAKNNKEFDYFDEYYRIYKGAAYYRDFVDKYQFNYLILSKGADCYLYTSLLNDSDFEQIYDSSDIGLFVRK